MATLGTDAYCEEAEIEGLTQLTIDSTSNPSTAEVDDFITSRAAEIDGVLKAMGYTVPVPTTATQASRVLKNINSKGAAADALNAKRTPGASGAVARSELAEAYLEEYYMLLGMLAETRPGKPRIMLTDHDGDDVAETRAAQTPAGGFYQDSDGDENDPVFTRDMDF